MLLDWVPAHFAKEGHGLGRFDGTPLYEHADPRIGEHPTWGSYIFDYGRAEVRNFLLGSARFWLEEFHVDGFRVDAVASMIWLDHARPESHWGTNRYGGRENLDAVEFLRRLNALVHECAPGAITVAEESTSYTWVTHLPGEPERASLGFDFKWNMGWMHDTLEYFQADPLHRSARHERLTWPIWYAFDEQYLLPLSHDEVVHLKKALLTKMPGDDWQRFANLRALYAYQYAHPGKKLLFMGGEFGQWAEWGEGRSLDWHLLESGGEGGSQAPLHRGLRNIAAGPEPPLRYPQRPAPARFAAPGLRLDRARGRPAQRDRLPAPGDRAGGRGGRRLQLHSRGAGGVPHRGARTRGVGGGPQHGQRPLRRERNREHGRLPAGAARPAQRALRPAPAPDPAPLERALPPPPRGVNRCACGWT